MQHEYVLRDESGQAAARHLTLGATGLLAIDGAAQSLKVLRRDPSGLLTALWGQRIVAGIVRASGARGDCIELQLEGRAWTLRLREAALDAMEQAMVSSAGASGTLEIISPIPGLVKAVQVQAGETVSAGQTLAVLEAMKMENEIIAPAAGVVQAIAVSAGQTVAAGTVLAMLEKR